MTWTFRIKDDALESTRTGSATVTVSAGAKYINIATEKAGADSDSATSTTVVFPEGSTYDGENTPLVTDLLVTKVKGNFVLETEENGGITLLEAESGGDVEVTFQFHVADEYVGQMGDEPSGNQRARVNSTSDPQGEWVTITETGATTRLFNGMVSLSGDAASSGAAGVDADDNYVDGGVWVQNGDAVTVTYMDGSNVIATDTVTVDTVEPQIDNISPAPGTYTRIKNPTISFDVTDTGSGIDITALPISLMINNVEASGVSYLSIDNGVRGIYARPEGEWGPYGVDTGNGVPFAINITATDTAGNTHTVGDDDSHTIDIDNVSPKLRMADATSKTTVVVMFDEPLDGDSLDSDGSDFEVADVLVTGAAADADDAKVVNLTVSELAPDAKPEVAVVGSIADNAGNEVDTANDQESRKIASDRIDATITSLDIDSALVGEDDEVEISLSFDEKLATDGLKVTVHGPTGDKEDVDRDTPLSGSATFNVGSSPTGMYGVSVQVTDLGNNTNSNLMPATETVSADGATLTLGNGPIGDMNFDGMVDGKDVTVSSGSVASVNASARTDHPERGS